jgi:LAO/AO transport system kinase
MELVEKALAGNSQALARLVSLIEREAPEEPQIMSEIFAHTGKAHTVGITGPPGAGKSSLVDKLTYLMRQEGLTVGIIAVDPTSPFTGGAVLGDRIRMQQHYLDDGVFIRSMATRGTRGGLPKTTPNVMKLLDASGKDVILVETVGVGQTELNIMETVDTIVVALVPEAGDTVQTMKAGLMEIADIFAVNKADRPGADYLVVELESMVHQSPKSWWKVPVMATQAINDIGVDELYKHIKNHRETMRNEGHLEEKRRQQRRKELTQTVEQTVSTRLWKMIQQDDNLARYLDMVADAEIDPYTACKKILDDRTLIHNWVQRLEAQG